jgi:hypothetical protein
VAASPSFASTLINTRPAWDGVQYIWPFGVPNTQTYGQLVTVPAGESSLTSFGFWIDDQGTAAPFLGEVYAWDSVNMRATGAALWESGPMSTVGHVGFNLYTLATGGVPVTAGQQYVLFLSTSKSAQTSSDCHWGSVADSVYAGGQFVYLNNGASAAQWTTVSWSNDLGIDLAFFAGFGGATINATDVPALDGKMLMLLAAALALVGVGALRFRTH